MAQETKLQFQQDCAFRVPSGTGLSLHDLAVLHDRQDRRLEDCTVAVVNATEMVPQHCSAARQAGWVQQGRGWRPS